jgi:hypothetical protein
MSNRSIRSYDPFNWYWIVAGSTTQVYSSAVVAYVPVGNATYVAWLAAGGIPTKIAVEQDLWDLLTVAGVAIPAGAATSDMQKGAFFDNLPTAVKVWAFAVDNRVRALEGQPARTAAQFKTYVKSLMQ